MRSHITLLAAVVGSFVLAALSSTADAAESYARLLNGEKFAGDVPAGAAIRLEFALASGTEPRFTLTLAPVAVAAATISFTEMRLFGPDTKEVTFDPAFLIPKPASKGRTSLSFKGFTATESGVYQFLIKTNAHVLSHVSGRFTVFRPKTIPFQGDETSVAPANPISVYLLASGGNVDTATLSVKRINGTAPKIAAYSSPQGDSTQFPQKTTKKGSATRHPVGQSTGLYSFTIGYQTGPPVGAWKGTIKVKPFKISGGFPTQLHLRNSPGVTLSVFDNDFSLTPSQITGGTGVGVATDGNVILVTSEGNNSLYGQLFDTELATIPGLTTATQLMTSTSDFAGGESISGHRTMFAGGAYFAAASTASGQSLSIVKFSTLLQVNFRSPVVSGSTDSTRDFFMTGDGADVSLGVAHPATKGHTVYVLNGANVSLSGTVSIGGASFPQSAGSAAAWRGGVDAVFELWTADTLDYHGPSDLHRVLYSTAWSPSTADAKPVAVPTQVETMPTAVTVDALTGVTIVHYVVADNPPFGPAGSGKICRRLFDPSGVEIPDSFTVLPRASCNRPVSTILGRYLYLGYEGPSGPVVDRYQLLR